MSTVSAPAAAQPLRRDSERGLLGGVCAGLARRLGVEPIVVRALFVIAVMAGGFGIALYGLAWALIPAESGERLTLPARSSWQVASGIALLALAALLLMREWGLWLSDAITWPLVLAAAGGALVWRQSVADAPARSGGGGLRIPADVTGRALLGTGLVVGAGLVFLWLNGALAATKDVLLAVVVVLVAGALILAPWWLRLVRGLTAERAERIRSQERAEVAAHLHDSVLQTLALMQKRAEDPREVAGLARRQERELRAWLSGRREAAGDGFAARLEAAAAEVEEDHGVPVDVVAVGDTPLDARAEALVAAAREAIVNAAKFAGGGTVSVYAEAEGDRVVVYVRDRGPGFDPAAVPEDRRGLRESIVGRMERHGGRAAVHTGAGEGTEVELVMER
jgi:signal transduction histidine kinase